MNVPRIAMDQPGWVWRAALGVAAFIIALPLVVLALLAVLAAACVFGVLAIGTTLVRRGKEMLAGNQGRENVRVIARER